MPVSYVQREKLDHLYHRTRALIVWEWGLAVLLFGLFVFGMVSSGILLSSEHSQNIVQKPAQWLVAMLIAMGVTGLALGVVWLWETIVSCMLLYHYWLLIPPEYRVASIWTGRVSPAVAVGFNFIPVFSLYWHFVSIWELARIYRYMLYGNDRSSSCEHSLILCIANAAASIPFVSIIIPLIYFTWLPKIHSQALQVMEAVDAQYNMYNTSSNLIR